MNSTVLSGVKLGDHTVVAANSVVTKSFPDGYCVLAGNPAKIVKIIDRKDVREYIHPYKYVGYRKIRE
jgi:acetyltransferase-like isoleucine patch superfamily enzyme